MISAVDRLATGDLAWAGAADAVSSRRRPELEPTGSGSADSGKGLGALTDGQREILTLVSEGCSKP